MFRVYLGNPGAGRADKQVKHRMQIESHLGFMR